MKKFNFYKIIFFYDGNLFFFILFIIIGGMNYINRVLNDSIIDIIVFLYFSYDYEGNLYKVNVLNLIKLIF